MVAGGSIHIYGALRGRAIAGTTGNPLARIFCGKLEAELVGIDGLYLGGAGCHGGPGITFIPGYNAAYQALDDIG